MGNRDGESISHEPGGTDEELSAWSFSGSMRRGMVKGIPAGHYTASKDNKAYAVRAAALLSEGTRSWSTSALWQAVSNDPEKKHNSQMDIVLALWKNDLIVGNS